MRLHERDQADAASQHAAQIASEMAEAVSPFVAWKEDEEADPQLARMIELARLDQSVQPCRHLRANPNTVGIFSPGLAPGRLLCQSCFRDTLRQGGSDYLAAGCDLCQGKSSSYLQGMASFSVAVQGGECSIVLVFGSCLACTRYVRGEAA